MEFPVESNDPVGYVGYPTRYSLGTDMTPWDIPPPWESGESPYTSAGGGASHGFVSNFHGKSQKNSHRAFHGKSRTLWNAPMGDPLSREHIHVAWRGRGSSYFSLRLRFLRSSLISPNVFPNKKTEANNPIHARDLVGIQAKSE